MSKQPKTKVPTDADLKGNPMIGGTKGVDRAGVGPDGLEDSMGDNTIEGDRMNDVNPEGGLDRTGGIDGRS